MATTSSEKFTKEIHFFRKHENMVIIRWSYYASWRPCQETCSHYGIIMTWQTYISNRGWLSMMTLHVESFPEISCILTSLGWEITLKITLKIALVHADSLEKLLELMFEIQKHLSENTNKWSFCHLAVACQNAMAFLRIKWTRIIKLSFPYRV